MFDFEKNLYQVLRGSEIDGKHEIVLPHEDSGKLFDSKSYLDNKCDLFIAEVSRVSTGLVIELGWADEYNVPILCVHKEDSEISGSLTAVSEDIEAYSNSEELIQIIEDFLAENSA